MVIGKEGEKKRVQLGTIIRGCIKLDSDSGKNAGNASKDENNGVREKWARS